MNSANFYNSKTTEDYQILSIKKILQIEESEKFPEFKMLNNYRNYVEEKLLNELSDLVNQKGDNEAFNYFIDHSNKWKREILSLSNYESKESLFFNKTLIEECENEIINILKEK